MIVAIDRAGVIGVEGKLPWHLPNDLRRFKALTMGKPIIMGRRTHASIGRALPGRRNIVLTSNQDYSAPGCECFATLGLALATIAEATEAMIIGGAALYREGLPLATRLYLTEVEVAVEGDVYFPAMVRDEWRQLESEQHYADAAHAYDYRFSVLERIT